MLPNWLHFFYKESGKTLKTLPPVHLHLIFKISIDIYWSWNSEKIAYFKPESFRLQQAEKSSSNKEKNQVHQIRYFKLENLKNQKIGDMTSLTSNTYIS